MCNELFSGAVKNAMSSETHMLPRIPWILRCPKLKPFGVKLNDELPDLFNVLSVTYLFVKLFFFVLVIKI